MMRRSTWISVVDADYRKGLIAAPDISVRSNRWICPARLTISSDVVKPVSSTIGR